MKKGLLTIAAGLLISASVSAQMTWGIDDSTTVVNSLTGFIPANGFDSDPLVKNVDDGWASQYTHSWTGANNDIIKIVFTQNQSPQYDAVAFNTIQWNSESGSQFKFTKNSSGVDTAHAVAYGQAVDFTAAGNASVSFDYQTSAAFYLRVDMGDNAGKTTNTQGLGLDLLATAALDITDEAKWQTLTFSWDGDNAATKFVDGMSDSYSPKWWDVPAAGQPADLEKSRIIKMAMTFNDGAHGSNVAPVSTTDFYLRNLVWGTAPSPATFALWSKTNISSISGAELKVVDGVIYSAGTISVSSVSGQKLASAQGQLSIDALPAGVLIITTAEGTAKIVK